MKEALKNDRARIQVGHISHFGLLEMSRQRLRPSLAETSFIPCPHCGGTGHVRSTENAAIHVLRGIEDEGGKRRAAEIMVHVADAGRAVPAQPQARAAARDRSCATRMRVIVAADDTQIAPQFRIERLKPKEAERAASVPVAPAAPALPAAEEEDEEDEEVLGAEETDEAAPAGEDADHRRRRRRRRRGGRRDQPGAEAAPPAAEPVAAPAEAAEPEAVPLDPGAAEQPECRGGGAGRGCRAARPAAGPAGRPAPAARRARRGRAGGRAGALV